MSDIKQPKLVLDEETSRFAHFKKSIRKPHKDEVALFAIFTGTFAAGVFGGAYYMNEAWKNTLTEFAKEAVKATAEDLTPN